MSDNQVLNELRALRAQVNRLESALRRSASSPRRLTTGEVAKQYRCSRDRVRHFCETGQLPATRQAARGRQQWMIRPDDAELILPGLLAHHDEDAA